MMIFRTLLFIVLGFTAFCLYAQTPRTKKSGAAISVSPKSQTAPPATDELAKHLSAAETYQLSGDLANASIENNQIIGIALQRVGAIALAENQLDRAIKVFNDSIIFNDNSGVRTNLAIAYLRASKNDEAIANAQAAVALDPKDSIAQRLLGQLLYAKGDYAAALPALESTIRLAPDFDSVYALGVTYLQLKQLERAKLLFEEMQTAVKNTAELHVYIGRAYEGTGYYAEAERELKAALAINPKTAKAHFFIGYLILQHSSERLSEAGREFDQELALNPADFYSSFFRGVVYNSESEHAKAIAPLQKAVQLNPKSGEAHLFLGQSQSEIGDNAAAEKSLRRAVELTADASKNSFQIRRAHFLLGRVLLKTGRRAEAEKELIAARELQGQLLDSARDEVGKILGQVVSSDKTAPEKNSLGAQLNQPNQLPAPLSAAQTAELKKAKTQLAELLAQAFHNLGVIAAQQNLLNEGLTRFASAAEWKPDFAGLNRNWGITAFRAAAFDQAAAPLAKHLKTRPEDALARRMLGVSYYLTKNFKQAVETLKPIQATLGSDQELAYFYGISLASLDRQPEAAAVFSDLAVKNQKSAPAQFYAGQGFMIVGDYERAITAFRQARALDSNTAQTHYNAGQALIRLNRLDEAETEFRRELEINQADESAKYYLAYTLLERKTKVDEALILLRDAIAARSDFADARYQLGKTLIEKGDFNEAIEQLEAAAASDPKKDYIHYQLSIAYRRVARAADAERELKLFRELKDASKKRETPAAMGAKQNAP